MKAPALAAAGLALLLAGCASDSTVAQAATNVFTLRSGTMSELRNQRGQGPFTTYDRPPAEMVEILGEAARKARGAEGKPVGAIFVQRERGEVCAKERTPELADDEGYDGEFLTAMIAYVHAVPGRPGQSSVEIHATARGPFHGGSVEWQRDMPRWIDEVMAAEIAPIR